LARATRTAAYGASDRPRAGADIEHAGRAEGDDLFDDTLRLGSGDEHLRLHLERARPELALTGEVGDRDAVVRSTADELSVTTALGFTDGRLESEVEIDPSTPEHVGEKKLGIEPGRRQPVLLKVVRRPSDERERGPLAHDSS
jgi:hypothetical protein